MSHRPARPFVLALLVLASSCSDVLSPWLPSSGAAVKSIDVSVATVSLDIIYDGASIGSAFGPPGTSVTQGDRCFQVTVDGAFRTTACGTLDVQNLTPGPHTIGLQDLVPTPGSPLGAPVDVAPPVSVNLVGGTSTPVSFDITAVRGKLTAEVRINGVAPPNFQYSVCIQGGSCADLVGGLVSLFARPGDGVAHVRAMANFTNILEIPFTAIAGETVDLGVFDVQFGSLAVDLLFDGASIGSSFAPPGQAVVQGERCFQLVVDGGIPRSVCGATTIPDIPPGEHTLVLKDLVPMPGNPLGAPVEVQPPVTVTVTGGASTPVSFDISAVRGKLTGEVRINGAAPPNFQYQLCVGFGSCGELLNGQFAVFARPGDGVAHVRAMANFTNVLDIPFTAIAGETIALGTFDVQFGSLAVDLLYNGTTIGSSFASPGQAFVQGERCFQLYVDGGIPRTVCGATTIDNIPPGEHTIVLKDLVPMPGNPLGAPVEVQPPMLVSVTGGASTPVSFDISAIRGKVAGQVRINGAAPPNFQYQICLGQTSCGELLNGQFTMFARVGSGTGQLRAMAQFATLAEFSFIVAAGNTTLIGGVSTAAPGSTPAGSDVIVLPVNQTTGTSNTTIGLTFANVSTPGTTTVVQSNTGTPPPTGLQLGTPPVYFDITTTASFTGPVEVCINYTGTTFEPGATIELLHGESDGSWTVVTTSHNTVDRIICGSVTSFSPFVVARRTSAPTVPPSVTPTVTGTLGLSGWYISNVTISWNVSGNGSPITSSEGCGDVIVSSNTGGTTYTCKATSAAGMTSESVLVKRDATNPLVSYTGNAGTYGVDEMVSITCSASDATSGLASDTCANINGAAYTFWPGVITRSATATDNAGNEAGATTSFQVVVTSDGLCRLAAAFAPGLANSLCAKLDAAAAARARGNSSAAENQVGAFLNELRAQSGKKISAEKAEILSRLAGGL